MTTETKLKCPHCGKSKGFEILGSATTLMATRHYVDEKGEEHFDNPNISTTEYRCWNCEKDFKISP